MKSDTEKVEIYSTQVALYTNQGKYNEAMKIGNVGLKALNLPALPSGSWLLFLIGEILKINISLRKKDIDDLLDLPTMTSSKHLSAMTLLNHLCPPAFFISKNLVSLIFAKMVATSINHGSTDVSAYGYASYGLVLGPALGKYNDAYKFGELSLKTLPKFDNKPIEGRSHFMYAGFIHHWKERLQQGLAHHKKAFELCKESGDYVWAGYAACGYIYTQFCNGTPLETLFQEADRYYQFSIETKHDDISHDFILTKQMVLSLQGKTNALGSFETESYKEQDHINEMSSIHRKLPLHQYYFHKCRTHYIFNQYPQALEMAKKAAPLSEESLGFIYTADELFFYTLSILSLYTESSLTKKLKFKLKLLSNIKKIKTWATHSPHNFSHKLLTIEAELARIKGNASQFTRYIKEAIQTAAKEGFIQDAAIACEIAGRYSLNINKKDESKK